MLEQCGGGRAGAWGAGRLRPSAIAHRAHGDTAGTGPHRACGGAPPASVLQASCHPEPLRGAAAQAGPLVALTPQQAQADGALHARVCWGGGLRTLSTSATGRVCMVLL